MITFFVCLLVLLGSYFINGKIVEKIFHPTDDPTPALVHPDGVDYVPMSTPRVFLIQALNVIGLGPIFGGLAGAQWGPIVFIWIVLGNMLGGAVHDFSTGMMSIRNDGKSISEITGIYLGSQMKNVMRVFSVILTVLVGTVFATGPATLLAIITKMNMTSWLIIILIYYFLATLLPIDKIIGKIYPILGICLFIMAFGVAAGIIVGGYKIPEMTLANLHPAETPIWPYMFITVACGSISGFHATQSPMMARCIKTEKDARKVFYGAMTSEGVIALVWAAAGVAFYGSTGGLANALSTSTQNGVVYEICKTLLGPVGAILAMIGVIACPITSGDTAFRSARLTIADWFNIDQQDSKKRLLLSLPLLLVGGLLSQIDFQIIWRYFSWSNQTLAMIVLWTASVYLVNNKKNYLITVIPAVFMSAVTTTYILIAKEGLRLPERPSYFAGFAFAAICLALFINYVRKFNKGNVN